MNCYRVDAKCGHVRRTNYIVKSFYVHAKNGREAATFVRYLPHVKHHDKRAIIKVEEISIDEYLVGRKMVDNDPYFNVDNSSDQRRLCNFQDDEIIKEESKVRYQKPTHRRKQLVELLMSKEWKSGRNFVYE